MATNFDHLLSDLNEVIEKSEKDAEEAGLSNEERGNRSLLDDFDSESQLVSNIPHEIFQLSQQLLKQYKRLKNSQKKTKKLKEFSDKVINSISDGIVVITPDFWIQFMNDAFDRMFGEARGMAICREVFERFIDENNCFSPEFDQDTPGHGTIEYETADERAFLISYSPFEKHGGIASLLVIFKDVTELKQLQHQLLQSEKLSSIGTLISGIAHELNNPLTGVMGYAELLMETDDCRDEIKRDLMKIHKEATRCQKIVQNLLVFTRSHKPVKKRIDINKALLDTLELRRYQLEVENIHVEVALSERPLVARADPYQLQQVFLNIINNAHQAIQDSNKSHGKIVLKTQSVTRRRKTEGDSGGYQESNVALIEIQDNGAGIKESDLKQIFDPFFTTKVVGRGTGLGLSISYGIIREHEGNIHVKSQLGKGSSFTIDLPLVSEAELLDDHTPGSNREKLKNLRILVVDDEPIICEMLAAILEKNSHKVVICNKGQSAIDILKVNDNFDMLFSDLKMPGVDGQELFEWIKQNRPNLVQRVIFMSGDTLSISTQNFLQISARYHVSKPFEFDQIFDAIDKTLNSIQEA